MMDLPNGGRVAKLEGSLTGADLTDVDLSSPTMRV